MTPSNISASGAASRAAHAGRTAQTSRWLALLVRSGYAAKGVIYLLIGLLTARVAIGAGGAPADRTDVLRVVYDHPFGRILLTIVAIGLAGYALWSIVRALIDPEGEGRDAHGIIARLGFAAVGISYILLAVAAFRLVLGAHTSGKTSDATTRDWTARLLALPFGPVLVVLVGLVVVGIAIMLCYRAYSARFQKRLDLARLNGRARTWVVSLGRCGYAALGVVFAIIGIFLVVAALRHNPNDAKGLGGALWELTHHPYGHLLLGIVALGLAAYGAYALAQARFRRVGSAA